MTIRVLQNETATAVRMIDAEQTAPRGAERSNPMSDELADQIKAHAAEKERRRLLQAEQQNLQKIREEWLYSLAAYEYEDLVRYMNEEVEDTKSKTGNFPEF